MKKQPLDDQVSITASGSGSTIQDRKKCMQKKIHFSVGLN